MMYQDIRVKTKSIDASAHVINFSLKFARINFLYQEKNLEISKVFSQNIQAVQYSLALKDYSNSRLISHWLVISQCLRRMIAQTTLTFLATPCMADSFTADLALCKGGNLRCLWLCGILYAPRHAKQCLAIDDACYARFMDLYLTGYHTNLSNLDFQHPVAIPDFKRVVDPSWTQFKFI